MRAWELNEEVTRKIKTPEFEALMTPELKKVGSLYKTNGYDLRIVGGAVRDLMLGKTPKDIDLASDATPVQSIAMLMDIKIETIQHLFDVLLPAPNELQEAIANLDSRTGIRVVLTGVGMALLRHLLTVMIRKDLKSPRCALILNTLVVMQK